MSIAPVQCPYIPEHKMHIDSFITHLNRCKAPNKHLFVNCYYNSLHVVLKENYQEHLINCEDRIIFMNQQSADRQEDEWDQGYYYERQSTQNRTGSHISSSSEDQQYYDYQYHQYYEKYGYDQQPYYDRMLEDQHLPPKSYFSNQTQPKTHYPSKETKYQNNSLEFSFGKDYYQSRAQTQVQNKNQISKHDNSFTETCQSSFSIKNGSNRESMKYESNDDDDQVLELIQAIDFKTNKVINEKQEPHDKLRNRFEKLSVHKKEERCGVDFGLRNGKRSD